MLPLKKRRRHRPTVRRARTLDDCARAEWRCLDLLRDRWRASFGGDGGRGVGTLAGNEGAGEAKHGWKDDGRRDQGPILAKAGRRRRVVI